MFWCCDENNKKPSECFNLLTLRKVQWCKAEVNF
uniref:Uncharacterized protein n=1 Tax=Anguilla anguilla TaxID=7936 RepID=A0A0E9TA71_ANGAN